MKMIIMTDSLTILGEENIIQRTRKDLDLKASWIMH
jgi:hypothetical protein